jgi:hypothetical protein
MIDEMLSYSAVDVQGCPVRVLTPDPFMLRCDASRARLRDHARGSATLGTFRVVGR